jgi:Zn-dependent protease
MQPQNFSGSFHLFRIAGIDVRLHWSWFIMALIQLGPMMLGKPAENPEEYSHPIWLGLQYIALFAIVLAHEFGHALACRSVGGTARDIVLWPLGGIAFVSPPANPGAVLWTIFAGPLVNLVLILPFGLLAYFVGSEYGDLHKFFKMMVFINIILFVFNMVPSYPLDGGQILHAILWYFLGRWESLRIAAIIGMVFGGLFFLLGLLLAAINPYNLMLVLIAAFVVMQSLAAFRLSGHALHMENLPRHTDCACPGCYAAPPKGPFWVCEECQTRFDTFDSRGKCPACGMWYLETACPNCRQAHHIDRWYAYRPGIGLAPVPAEEDGPIQKA